MSGAVPYWTLERLRQFVEVLLDQMAMPERGALVLGRRVTLWSIHDTLSRNGFRHSFNDTTQGVNLLLRLGVIGPSKAASRHITPSRPFHPQKIESVTVADLARCYQGEYLATAGEATPSRGTVRGSSYWTAEHLRWVAEVLKQCAQQDSEGWYFGPGSLQAMLHERVSAHGFEHSQLATPLRMLVSLGVIAPGKAGAKKPDYKRRFYPDTPITDEAVRAYHAAVQRRNRGS